MNIPLPYKRNIAGIICYLYVLLFVYAAVSKLLDFENFRIQLGQSPMLSVFAGSVALLVPVLELFFSGLLLIPKWRLVGLFGAYTLMLMFTTYIYVILNYSSFVPCSCGGILEKLDWNSHMTFNLAYTILAIIGILILSTNNKAVHHDNH